MKDITAFRKMACLVIRKVVLYKCKDTIQKITKKQVKRCFKMEGGFYAKDFRGSP
mgnify:CR=1 FL=1|jgi:hypothetical protein